MKINDWIEIDKDYKLYLDMKQLVIKEQGKVVLDSMPENDEGCCELLETLVDYLPKVKRSSTYETTIRGHTAESIIYVTALSPII